MADWTIDVQHLDFDFGGPKILRDVNLQLGTGSRCLLVGANGAGKTTLLKILAGQCMVQHHVRVLGKDAYLETPRGVVYLGTEWASNPVVRSDLTVDYLIKAMGGDRFIERRNILMKVLDVKDTWRLHQVSDGERRRVQLVMGLLRPWRVLLLDEVTVDLDILVRADFLNYLKQQTETQGCTIVYATHIFDGIGDWLTHIAHMAANTVVSLHDMNQFPEYDDLKQRHRDMNITDSPLMSLCLSWLKHDRDYEKEQQKRIESNEVNPATGPGSDTDKTKFYKFYNYWTDYRR